MSDKKKTPAEIRSENLEYIKENGGVNQIIVDLHRQLAKKQSKS